MPFRSISSKLLMAAIRPMSTAKVPAPRPSASLVIINDRNEVLMVQRNPESRSFAGVTVFPGGNYDKNQDTSFETTAIRETFEESGLLLALSENSKSPALTDAQLDEARNNVHARKLLFQDFMRKHSLKPDSDSLLPFTQWITPTEAPRRFHTYFYVAFLPSATSSGFSSGHKQERIPKPDGGQEVISARFIRPESAIQEFQEQKITFMPPQYYILYTLSQILRTPSTTLEQQDRIRQLSKGPFGAMTILPMRYGKTDDQGRATLLYNGDEQRGGPKGRLHRASVTITKGITTKIQLHRNFDIFTEQAMPASSKL